MGLAIRAHVITVSDGVSAGVREDKSGDELASILVGSGFAVGRSVVADEQSAILAAILDAAANVRLVLTTGGTGFGPRDVTPEATDLALERQAPGVTHLMMARGLESTPMAALSRGRAGSIGDALVVNLPGSPTGAVESLQAIIELIPHILDLLSGDTEHR